MLLMIYLDLSDAFSKAVTGTTILHLSHQRYFLCKVVRHDAAGQDRHHIQCLGRALTDQCCQVCLRVMFTAILGGFMDHQFGLDVKRALLKPMVEGSIEVYLRVSQELLPTPARAHYTFNLRDLSKVFQGILMIKARQVGLQTAQTHGPAALE